MRSMLLAAVTVACCSVAQAQNPARGWYVGFDAGMSRLDGELDDRDNQVTLPFDDDSATLAAHAGYRFNRVLQLGVFYADYGNFSGRDSGYALDADLRGVGLEFTVRIPVGEKFGVLGEVFAMNRRLDISAVAPGQSRVSEYRGGTIIGLGLGLNYQFNHQWDLRLEYAKTEAVGGDSWVFGRALVLDADLGSTTLGFRYKFPR